MKYFFNFFIGLMVLLINSASAEIKINFLDGAYLKKPFKVRKVENTATLKEAKEILEESIVYPLDHIVLKVNGEQHPDDTPLSRLLKGNETELNVVFFRVHPEVKKITSGCV